MSSNDGAKRRHEEASGVSDPPPRPVKRAQLKPPPPKPTDAPPCVLDLPPGVIANVGTFLSTRERAADLMALCIVFGPAVARTVRKTYLEHNMDYLDEISDLANALAMHAVDRQMCQNPNYFRKWSSMIRVRLAEWMSENEWWKDAAKLDSAYHEDNAAEAGVPVILKTAMLKDFATEEERNEFKEDGSRISPSGHADLCHYTPSSGSGPFDNNCSIVTSVNGTPCASFEHAQGLLLEEGSDKRLQIMHSVFAEMFFNPALIIDLGLLDVLKFQIEELKLDVNCQDYLGVWFRGGSEDKENNLGGTSILFHALVQPDQRLFDFLLSLKRLEVNPILRCSLDGTLTENEQWTLLHEMPMFASLVASNRLLDEQIDLIRRLRCILVREEVNVDCRCHLGFTPLEEVCEFWDSGSRMQYDLARLFLSVGADVLENALQTVVTHREMAIDDEAVEYIDELLLLLTAAQKKQKEAEET